MRDGQFTSRVGTANMPLQMMEKAEALCSMFYINPYPLQGWHRECAVADVGKEGGSPLFHVS